MKDKLTEILRETTKLFIKYGIRSLSMDDICRELGISKKTMYQYVSNKNELVVKVLEGIVNGAVCSIDMAKPQNLNAIDLLLWVSRHVAEKFQNFNPAMSFDLNKYYPEEYKAFIKSNKEILAELVKKNLQQGVDNGFYREDLDYDLIARLYVHNLETIQDPEFTNSEDFNFEKIFKVLFDSHIRSISNAKGIAYYEEQLRNNITTDNIDKN